ncbi:hypothetical protein Pedsa_3485 [Pseudopedobacter saltans DSM 12145]|uniref:Uncharacterized protein n=1 Tax=Pseudopedobacter saltans (strain ATCC 51119 / DSM 12145 / JCM 21818 / CCUG 39354 / LMG 10337 / NBRC 100064 / NCIMB 13643) TaxID=762903 RepID=F0SE95_PSESL|nr:hypothetical protein [Pseudopedobacter saltans]ADY54017.1 hypothetical protein Pedsa_3485 [Pseudopedobacter saltans DSM 12145]
MNQTLKKALIIPVFITSYLLGYLMMYYGQLFAIEFLSGEDINSGINQFTFPLLCSGAGMYFGVILGTKFSPLTDSTTLKIFLFILLILIFFSSVTFFTNGFTIRTVSEIIGLTAGYIISRTEILQKNKI